VILTGVDGKIALGGAMKDLLGRCPAGGIMLFRYNLDAGKDAARAFLSECSSVTAAAYAPAGVSPVPPFIAVDHEGGSVHRFGPGVSRLPPAASWRLRALREGAGPALAALQDAAFAAGKELQDLGITVNLAPVAEVLDDENRLFLDDRSFGEDPLFVEAAAEAFVRGMGKAGVACVLKHFPGNTGSDPHRETQVLRGDPEALRVMTRPFAALIEKNLSPAIMVSHALVPAVDGERIASLSPAVMRTWLRETLGFGGVILADDFAMAAAAGGGWDATGGEAAAVASLAAGADMVMTWPGTLRRTHAAITAALGDGRLSRERLRESAARIIAGKIRIGLL
jgi:beta-N-acetylhexosaminidase